MESIYKNKYKEGDVVYQKAHPDVRLVVRRYFNRMYYCMFQDDAKRKELVFFEREIETSPHSANPDY